MSFDEELYHKGSKELDIFSLIVYICSMVNSHMISITSSYEELLLTLYNNFIHGKKQSNHYCAH